MIKRLQAIKLSLLRKSSRARVVAARASLGAALGLAMVQTADAAKKPKAKPKPAVTAPAWQQAALKKAVIVRAFEPSGELTRELSGSLSDPRAVVTVCHPLVDAAKIEVEVDGSRKPATLQYTDRGHDLCQLEADLSAEPFSRTNARKLKVGTPIYGVVGAEGVRVIRGKVKALRPLDESLYIEPDFTVTQSMAGGALLNAKGELVGILMSYLPEDGINFAAPADWIRELPERNRGDARFVMNEGSRLSWLNKAIALEQKQDWQELEAWGRRWTRAEPNDRWAWFTLANALSRRGTYRDAAQAYQRGLRIKPDYAVAWNNLGTAYTYLKQPAKAAAAHEIAIRLAPDSASAWFNLGIAYESQQRYDDAVRAYAAAARLKPENAAAWLNIGRMQLAQQRYDAAEESLRKALELEPDNTRALYNLGIVHIQTNSRRKLDDVIERLAPLDAEKAALLRR